LFILFTIYITIQKEFFLSSLEYFGLPEGFIDGKGHFPNWGKDQKNDKSAAAKKKQAQKNAPKKKGAQ
jgi:hypothetical protein